MECADGLRDASNAARALTLRSSRPDAASMSCAEAVSPAGASNARAIAISLCLRMTEATVKASLAQRRAWLGAPRLAVEVRRAIERVSQVRFIIHRTEPR